MKSAALALIVIVGALILAGTFFMASSTVPTAPDVISTTAPGGPGKPDQPATMGGPEPVTPSAAEAPERSAVTEPAIGQGGSVTLRAVDAVTGQAILKYWVAPAGLEDLASAPRPELSDPASGEVAIPATAWKVTEPTAGADFLVSAPMYQPTVVRLEAPGTRDVTTRVELLRASGIVGVVRDGASAPLASARVTLEYLFPLDSVQVETTEAIALPESYQGATLRRTDVEGRYAFGQLPEGVYRTRVARDGTEHLSDPIVVHPGRWTPGDHWLDEHVRLAVSVARFDGRPAARSRVLLLAVPKESDASVDLNALLPEDAEILATRYTDDEGRATLGPISPGTYQVFLQSDEGAARPRIVTVDESSRSILELELVLDAAEGQR